MVTRDYRVHHRAAGNSRPMREEPVENRKRDTAEDQKHKQQSPDERFFRQT